MTQVVQQHDKTTIMSEIKCVFVGNPGVGKSSLIMNYKERTFDQHTPPVVDACAVPVFFDGKSASLKVWDSAGHSDYDRVRYLLYPESDICLVCFSVDNLDSYTNVEGKWLPELSQHRPNTPVMLVGTKTDLRDPNGESIVTYDMGEELMRRTNAVSYIECSARTQDGVRQVFQEAARAVVSIRKEAKKARRKQGCVLS